MITNPVYKREMTVSARSIRIPVIIAGFNLILAAFALFSMLAAISIAKTGTVFDYKAFLVIFRYVAIIEFALILFITPALTAGSISGERERRTLDLMLTTKLTPAKIVTGKLMISLSTVGILVVSSLPILALVFVYGGINIRHVFMLVFSFFAAAVFTAGIGIWSSSISDRSTIATAIAYAIVILFTGGSIGLYILINNFKGTEGMVYDILSVSPAAVFYGIVGNMTGNGSFTADTEWIIRGLLIQLVIGMLMILFAIGHVGARNKH